MFRKEHGDGTHVHHWMTCVSTSPLVASSPIPSDAEMYRLKISHLCDSAITGKWDDFWCGNEAIVF